MLKSLLRLLLNPARLFRLITVERLRRLWFYMQTQQFSVIVDRVRRLFDLGSSQPVKLTLYSVADRPGRLEFPKYENPLVSIVVPVFNQWQTTRSCLLSILQNSGNISYEVIVADDGSGDETCNISLHTTNVKTIVNETNLGFLRNCNNAARYAVGRYLVLLNNDTNVQPGWLSPLVELMEKDASIGLAGSKLLYPDGRLQEAGGIIWQDGSGWNYGRMDFPERPEYNYVKEVDYISGASIMIRKALWDEIGGFDERFVPAYYEDTDLAFEIRRRGFKVMYQPRSLVVHLEGVSHGKSVHSGPKAYQVVNQAKFRAKWRDVLAAEHGIGVKNIFTSRDRSGKKKTVLFIDHYVPMFDQDAGSKSTFQYLQLMVEMGYRVKFLGDNFVDHQPYTASLQQMGIEVLYGPWHQRNWKKWIAQYGRHFDYAYLSRPHISPKYLNHIKGHTAAKLLYCGHDLHYLREERHYQLERKNAYLTASRKWKKIESSIACNVDISYFFSDFEVNELKKQLPNCTARTIPLFLFDEAELEPAGAAGFASRRGLLFVGGFMHTPNMDAVHWFVEDIYPLIRAKLPEVEFIVVGSNPPAEIVRLAGNGVVIAGRLSDEELKQQYRHCRLVVAPLRYGAGVKGKIVEAMRYGVPTVTTSIGAEGIGDAQTALFVADEASVFAEQVIKAYTDAAGWNAVADRATQAVRRHFSKKTARDILMRDMPLD
jgi:GT2 family glycosyltransferase